MAGKYPISYATEVHPSVTSVAGPISHATEVVSGLINDEQHLHRQLREQEFRVARAAAQLRQERAAVEATKAILVSLRPRIYDAVVKLEDKLGGAMAQEQTKILLSGEIMFAQKVLMAAKESDHLLGRH